MKKMRYEEDDNQGSFIERLWPGFLLIEQKRTNVNVDLKIAKEKSHRLCKNLSENKCPRCIMISDFNIFWESRRIGRWGLKKKLL